MKECTNDYFEDDITQDELTDALERENVAILEIELEMKNEPEVSGIPEASTRKQLKRELEQEALARLEDSARTEEEFANVVTWWNRLDAIYDCPFEMHELVTDENISKSIFALKDAQKKLLYQLAIKGYSCQVIAAFREQTDRNIRKIRDTMLKKIRKSFMQALQSRVDNLISLTKQEQIFYDNYRSLITDKKNKKMKEITNTI